jgi:hypothetical protein
MTFTKPLFYVLITFLVAGAAQAASCASALEELETALQAPQIFSCSSGTPASLVQIREQVHAARAAHGPAMRAVRNLDQQVEAGWAAAEREAHALAAPNTGNRCLAVSSLRHLEALAPQYDNAIEGFEASLKPVEDAKAAFTKAFGKPSLKSSLAAKVAGRDCTLENIAVDTLKLQFGDALLACDAEALDFHHPITYEVQKCRSLYGDIYDDANSPPAAAGNAAKAE